jgi:two-component system LytT family response regulator
MAKLRALIVDDEPLARERLKMLLAAEPTVEIIGQCGDGLEAIKVIQRDSPDIVFLDIEMPGCDGLQVLADLSPERRPAVIFVTAHERFALEAFNVRAVDYLLKPFDRERFHTALTRAAEYIHTQRTGKLSERIENMIADAPAAPQVRKAERLAIKTDGKVVFLRPDEIEWIEAADNYVILHLADRKLMTRDTLSALETQLGTAQFARINRSTLVHLDQVKELQPAFHGDYVVILRNGARLPLSRAFRGQLGRFITGTL